MTIAIDKIRSRASLVFEKGKILITMIFCLCCVISFCLTANYFLANFFKAQNENMDFAMASLITAIVFLLFAGGYFGAVLFNFDKLRGK